jgi:hypothetical protein
MDTPLITTVNPTDFTDAACAEQTVEVMFPDRSKKRADIAKMFCAGCQHRDACLAFALELDTVNGVWGGVWLDDPTERREAYRNR